MTFAPYYKRLLTGVDEDTVMRLEATSQVRVLDPHTYLFDQYSTARGVYVLEEGVIIIERSSAAGRRQILGFSYPGDFIGLIRENYFEYSVQSLTKSRIREFPLSEFQRSEETSEALKGNVFRIGGALFSHALDQVIALGQKKAHERVCYLLQEIHNRGVSEDPACVELPMTRQDMADYLGLTMETVSRAIRRLKKDGVIEIERKDRIRLRKPEVIRELGSVSGI